MGFDVGGRLISGGGSVVKVWQEKMNLDSDEDSEEDIGVKKRAMEGSDSDDSDAADSSEEEGDQKAEGRREEKRKEARTQEMAFWDSKGLE